MARKSSQHLLIASVESMQNRDGSQPSNGEISINPTGDLMCDCPTYARKSYCNHLLTLVSGKPESRAVYYNEAHYPTVTRLRIPLFKNWFMDHSFAYAAVSIQSDGHTQTLSADCSSPVLDFDEVIDIWIGGYSIQIHGLRKIAMRWAAGVLETCDSDDALLGILQCTHPEHHDYISKGLGLQPLNERVQRDFWSLIYTENCWRCSQRERLLIPVTTDPF